MEYRFRGFDAVGNKGWVYGDLVHNKRVDLTDRVMVGGYEVVPESVGMWTGLKDELGKDIYENDIVQFRKFGADFKESDCVATVAYKNGAFNISQYKGFRIIGNVFEKKELFGTMSMDIIFGILAIVLLIWIWDWDKDDNDITLV